MSREQKLKAIRLAAFSVLMQGESGISSKSSTYILEKFEECMQLPVDQLPNIMDMVNRSRFLTWVNREFAVNEKHTAPGLLEALSRRQ